MEIMEGEEVQQAETSFTVELMGLHEESMWIPLISMVGEECFVLVKETTVKYNYEEEKYYITVRYEGLLDDIKHFNDVLKQKSEELVRNRNVNRKFEAIKVN